jgi:predicted extracellular nuclease
MDRYKRLMALLLGLVLSLSFLAVFVPMEVAADDPDDGLDLFFSEYIEGSSNNKAVEIYNPSANDINLSAYSVVIYANGSNSPGNIIRLVGILKSKEVYVLGHSSANQSGIKDKADQISSSLGFNGNDAVVLKRGDVIIDCIGQIGYDPGTQWKSNNVSTLDMTLLRKPSVTHGRTDTGTFDPSEEWIGLPVDTFSYLGNDQVRIVGVNSKTER